MGSGGTVAGGGNDLMNERWIARLGGWRESGGRLNDRVRFEVEKRVTLCSACDRWQVAEEH